MSEVKNPREVGQGQGRRLNLDSALAAWPSADRPASDWEAQAEQIEGAIGGDRLNAATRHGHYDATVDIFAPPSPATPEEVQDSAASAGSRGSVETRPSTRPSGSALPTAENKMQPTERERDRKSLQDLARLASAPSLTPLAPRVAATPAPESSRPAEAKQGDSGIVDLKMIAKADPRAEERARTTPLASAELFDDDGRPSQEPPASAGFAAAPASVRAPVQAIAAPKQPSPGKIGSRESEKKGSGAWFAMGGAITIVAIAAAAVLMLRSPQHDAPQPVAVSPPSPVVAPASPPKSEVAKNETKPEVVAQAAPQGSVVPSSDGIDIAKLPFAENTTKSMTKAYVGGGSPPPKPARGPVEKPIDPKLIANNLPPSPDQGGTLNDALKQASGNQDDSNATTTPAATGPAFAAGSVPQKPSQGAVTGALGAVMPTVRACLQPDDPISRASVVFDSTGAVTGITVTGYAAGKPAEACIKSALGKAKVQPFAQPNYTANVTIRPN